MSLHEYRQTQNEVVRNTNFYALIMAAMRRADSYNEAKLRAAFPEVWEELLQRYNAPGGVLPEDSE
jgi:hypothetical protein